MGKLSCLRKRANKKEYKARLKQEMEARGSTITGLQMKLQKATEELKIVKRKLEDQQLARCLQEDKMQRNAGRTPHVRKTSLANLRQMGQLQSMEITNIPAEELQMKQNALGEGTFGRCAVATYKGQYEVCVKKMKRSVTDEKHLLQEAKILSILGSHRYIPHCFGVCLSELVLVTSLHTVDGKSIALDEALQSGAQVLEKNNVVKLLYQVATALSYIHTNGYLHNDVKGSNIILDGTHPRDIQAYLIDFGKACLRTKGKRYCLSAEERIQYRVKHPQIAPDLRDGLITQCAETDIYAIGRVISIACKTRTANTELEELTSRCLSNASKDRPGMSELLQVLQAAF